MTTSLQGGQLRHRARPHLRIAASVALVLCGLTSCSDPTIPPDDSPGTETSPSTSVTSAPSATPSTPEPSPTSPAHTVLMHDGVIQAALPETFAPDSWGSWTDGTATIGCWAWRDPTIPVEGVTAAQITATWIAQWNDWGYYSAGDVQPFSNVDGYEDGEIWFIVVVYETPGGDYDFEVWEPHAYLIDDDVFIECSARVFSPADDPPYGWDAAFLPLVESVTIVDRDAILPNVWGTERGDY